MSFEQITDKPFEMPAISQGKSINTFNVNKAYRRFDEPV